MTQRTKKEMESFCSDSLNPDWTSLGHKSLHHHRHHHVFVINLSVSLNAGCARWQPLFFLNSNVRERPCRQLISHSSIYILVSSEIQVQILIWALCMKKHLCCDCGVMLEKRRGGGGDGGGWVGRCLWSLNWHSQTSVVLYLSHPSDSNSYTLRCLYILTLGLQGHNLKRYPVKNVEKYKIKIDMFGGKANEGKGQNTRKRTQWNHSPKDSRSLTTEQNQMLRPCRVPSFALKGFLSANLFSAFDSSNLSTWNDSLHFFWPRCQRWHKSEALTAKPRVATAASPP